MTFFQSSIEIFLKFQKLQNVNFNIIAILGLHVCVQLKIHGLEGFQSHD